MQATSINFESTDEIRSLVGDIQRTEDIVFSPGGSCIAIADFNRSKIILLGLAVGYPNGHPVITLTRHQIISSDAIRKPHGISFLDAQNMLVASRDHKVALFKLPGFDAATGEVRLPAQCLLRGGRFTTVHTPGSIANYALGSGRFRVLVCNNYIHQVSAHTLQPGSQPGMNDCSVENRYLLRQRLNIPDGICVSSDTCWIAVSNHMTGEVFVYDNRAALHTRSRPDGVLQGIVYPHGLKFTPDGRHLVVADAGSPYLHIFTSADGDWHGKRTPHNSIRVLDNLTFAKGHFNLQEGGFKGIDIDSTGRLLVATCEHSVLKFHDMQALLDTPAVDASMELAVYLRERDAELARSRDLIARCKWICGPLLRRLYWGVFGM